MSTYLIITTGGSRILVQGLTENAARASYCQAWGRDSSTIRSIERQR